MREQKLICFDIEATGPDPATDRIVQIAAIRIDCHDEINILVNPGRSIPPASTAIHGIRDEDVEGQPNFEQIASGLMEWFKGAHLLGFNLTNFDVPLLWEEFYRNGLEWDLTGVRLLDAGTLMKRREQRTLEAAVQFYCGRKHEGAHDALADVKATWDVWNAQLERYQLWDTDFEGLEKESNYEEVRVDLAGKIVRNAEGIAVYNIGKSKGVPVHDDPSFAVWMLQRDFSAQTKMVLRRLLAEMEVAQSYQDQGTFF